MHGDLNVKFSESVLSEGLPMIIRVYLWVADVWRSGRYGKVFCLWNLHDIIGKSST